MLNLSARLRVQVSVRAFSLTVINIPISDNKNIFRKYTYNYVYQQKIYTLQDFIAHITNMYIWYINIVILFSLVIVFKSCSTILVGMTFIPVHYLSLLFLRFSKDFVNIWKKSPMSTCNVFVSFAQLFLQCMGVWGFFFN